MLLHISGCLRSRHLARSSKEPEDQELLAFVSLQPCSGHDVLLWSRRFDAFELCTYLNCVFRGHAAAVLRSGAEFTLRYEVRDLRIRVKKPRAESKMGRDRADLGIEIMMNAAAGSGFGQTDLPYKPISVHSMHIDPYSSGTTRAAPSKQCTCF
jgi:hypothetical protein